MAADKSDDVKTWRDRWLDGIYEASGWAAMAIKCRQYYHGNQWADATPDETDDRICITDNVIRNDIKHRAARILDGDPIIEPHGRGGEDFAFGDIWKDVVRWSEEWHGIEYDSVAEVRSQVVLDRAQTGEGVEKVYWCAHEEEGLGMVVSERKDPLNLVYELGSNSPQRRDCAWMVDFEPVPVEELEEEFPALKDKIKPDAPTAITKLMEQSEFEEYVTSMEDAGSSLHLHDIPKAYRREVWEKRADWVTRYIHKRTGKLAVMPSMENEDPDDEDSPPKMVPMDREAYERMPEDQRRLYRTEKTKTITLYQGVQINDHWAKRMAISAYDQSKKGHGEYPYAFYSGDRDEAQSHCHGEIEDLIGHQDIINRAMSRWLEALFITNSTFLAIQRGSAPRKDIEKLDSLGVRTLQRYFYYPGQPIPQFVGANPASAQIFQAGLQMLKQQKDDLSQVQGVNRNAPEYDLSGKAIRALQAEGDLSSALDLRGIVSGMQQATYLRLAILMQLFRGARLLRITPKADQEGYAVFTGESPERIQSAFNLEEEKLQVKRGGQSREVKTGFVRSNATGERGKILPISDKDVRKFDLRFKLDTGREARREERRQQVRTYLQYLGPAAGPELLKWAAQIEDLPDIEGFAAALDKEDAKAKAVMAIKQAQEATGMSFQEMVQFVQQAQANGGAPAGAAPAPAAGAPQGGPPQAGPPGPNGNSPAGGIPPQVAAAMQGGR